ncbi:hypothetical protein [Phenylobacterium sp.]|uniref:hypothetical protein n=1 Tax=Phenylobacterium sp. TaxID=1871053 RepID=UPI0039190A47
MKLQRVLILGGAAVVLTWAGMHILGNSAAAGLLALGGLATIGTELDRHPLRRRFAMWYGLLATGHSLILLALGARTDGWPLTIGYCAGALALLAGALTSEREAPGADADPPM